MSIDIDRLKVDAGYWKENGAPDDATHCAVHDPGKTWFKFGEDGSPMMWHMRFSEWREGLCKESRLVDLIPRLARADEPEWNGTDLPPVGTECEVLAWQNTYFKCKVLAHDGPIAVVLMDDKYPNAIYDGFSAEKFRPLRAQREREEIIIDALRHVDEPRDDEVHPRQYLMDPLHTLYDDGMLRRAGE